MTAGASPPALLLALGNPARRKVLQQRLTSAGLQVTAPATGNEVRGLSDSGTYKLLIIDTQMSGLDLSAVLHGPNRDQALLILLCSPDGQCPQGADLVLAEEVSESALTAIAVCLLAVDQRLLRATETASQLRLVFEEAKGQLHRVEADQAEGERRHYDLRQRFHRLIDANPAVIYATDAGREHRCLFVSRRFKELLGFEPQWMLGNNTFWQEHIHPDDRARVLSEFEHLIDAGGGGSLRYRFRHVDGSWHSLRDDFAVLRDGKGHAQEIIGCWSDISAEREAVARFDAIFRAVPDGILLTDQTGRILQANPALASIFGYPSPTEMEGKTIEILLPGELRERYATFLAEFFEHPHRRSMGSDLDLDGLRADGATVPIEVSLAPFPAPGGGPAQALATVRDVRERREQAQRIEDLVRAYSMLSAVNQAVINLGDEQVLLEAVCRIAVELGEYRLAWVGRLDREGHWLEPVASVGEVGYLREIRVSAQEQDLEGLGPIGEAIRSGDAVVCDDLEGDPRFSPWREAARRYGLKAVIALPLVIEGRVFGTVNLYSQRPQRFRGEELTLLTEVAGDLGFGIERIDRESRRCLAEARIEALAYHDELTGLINRAGFLQATSEALAGGKPLAVAVFDLARLREINLSLGYDLGDAVLKAVAQRLSGKAVIGHLGASIFAVLLPGVQTESSALGQLEDLLSLLDGPFEMKGVQIAVQYHAGLALAPRDGGEAKTLMRRADLAKEAAKLASGIACFRPDLEPDPAEQALLTRLVGALDDGQFLLYFQPKLDLSCGRPTAVEALVRWEDPEAGLQPPGRFIPLLEKTGLMSRLTPQLLAEAMATQARWLERGLDIRMAVNISAADLADRGLPEVVGDACVSAGIEARGLMLELTETAVLQDTPVVTANIEALDQMGVKLSIDDFGTGHASLRRLIDLPVSQIKIDQSFITPMRRSPDCQLIVGAAIALGHVLGLEVVAEGIEDIATLAMLREMGCDKGQGYVISRPLPEAELLAWLETHPPSSCPSHPGK